MEFDYRSGRGSFPFHGLGALATLTLVTLATMATVTSGCSSDSGGGSGIDGGGGGSGGSNGDGGAGAGGSGGGFGGGNWPAAKSAHVVYKVAGSDGHIFRVAASAGAQPEDVSDRLSASAGSDSNAGISRDGKWLALTTTRFGCGSWSCLALVATAPDGATATAGTLVTAGNDVVHPESRPAVARDASFVVYSAAGTAHSRDLFIVRRNAGSAVGDPGAFAAPVALTNGSTFKTHALPALSADEKGVICDCQKSDSSPPSLCTVALDGTGFRELISVKDVASSSVTEVHSGDFLQDGTIVFEGDWHAEQVWRRDAAGTLTTLSPDGVTNDNSPCALPDGRIASLWLGRAGNPQGLHELKVMQLDGTSEMIVTGVDIFDIGISCGE
jgi:hypothetical protein